MASTSRSHGRWPKRSPGPCSGISGWTLPCAGVTRVWNSISPQEWRGTSPLTGEARRGCRLARIRRSARRLGPTLGPAVPLPDPPRKGEGVDCQFVAHRLTPLIPTPPNLSHTPPITPHGRPAGEQWRGEPGGGFASPTGSRPAAPWRATTGRQCNGSVPKTGTPRRQSSHYIQNSEAKAVSGSAYL